jgi:hypothetical protein
MNISFARHQFPPAIIQHAVWLYVRFTLSYRDVEDLLADRNLDVSHETVRRWVLKFGIGPVRQAVNERPLFAHTGRLDSPLLLIARKNTCRCPGARRAGHDHGSVHGPIGLATMVSWCRLRRSSHQGVSDVLKGQRRV